MSIENVQEKEWTGNEAYSIFEEHVRFLQGEVLTIVDASFPDREQRKAVKDLIRSAFNDRFKSASGVLTGVNMLIAPHEKTPVHLA